MVRLFFQTLISEPFLGCNPFQFLGEQFFLISFFRAIYMSFLITQHSLFPTLHSRLHRIADLTAILTAIIKFASTS